MKSLIEKELPSSSEIYTGGDESLVESGKIVVKLVGKLEFFVPAINNFRRLKR